MLVTAAMHPQQRQAFAGLLHFDRPAAHVNQRAALGAEGARPLQVRVEARPDPRSRHREAAKHHTSEQRGADLPARHGANSKASAVIVPMKYGLGPSGRIQATSPVKGTRTPSTAR